jgi:ABC-type uncharacterized transport system permease subunit
MPCSLWRALYQVSAVLRSLVAETAWIGVFTGSSARRLRRAARRSLYGRGRVSPDGSCRASKAM